MLQFGMIVGSMLGIIGLATLAQMLRMRLRIRRAIHEAHGLSKPPETSNGAVRTGLPAPVQKYLQRALPAETKPITSAELYISGEIRPTPEADWRKIEAHEVLVVNKPALVWDAVIKTKKTRRSAQLIYVDETGLGSIRMFGVIPFMESHGDEADISLLSRFLTETVWFPTALASGGPVHWKALGDREARATIKDGQLRASATFVFDEEGDVQEVSCDDRFRDYRGSFVHEHFVMRCDDYREFSGFRIPGTVRFTWQNHNNSGQDFEYATFRVQDAEYAFNA